MLSSIEWIRDFVSGAYQRHPIPPMDGPLSPNERLDNLEQICMDVDAPDDVVRFGDTGALLVSSGCCLVVIGRDQTVSVLRKFQSPISAFTCLENRTIILACDDGVIMHLSSSGEELESVHEAEGIQLSGVTAFALDDAGGAYFSIGSTDYRAREWVRDLMDCNRKGLLGYWKPSQQPKLLRRGLAFPNGAAFDADHESLVITESWTHSVTRFRVVGQELSDPEILIENLPGYPARISVAAGGGYWLAIFVMRTLLVELVLREESFKKDMIRSLDPELWICPALASTGSHWEPLQMGGMKKLGIRKAWSPPRSYGLVLRIDADGEILDSMHSRNDGRYHGITAAREVNNQLIVVSKGGNKLLTMPLSLSEEEHI